MAILQERYIKITSSTIGESAIGERDLNGLVFTQGKGWLSANGVFGSDYILKCYNVDQVLKYFSSTSNEAKFARRYFSYISPSGTSPASLSFARVKVTDSDGDLLSYKETLVDGTLTGGWYTPSTRATVDATFASVPSNNAAVVVTVGSTVVFSGKFVSSTRTAKTDIKAGTTAEESAENFAATINGTAGFYGQTANETITAEVDSTNPAIVHLSTIKTGALSPATFSVTVSGTAISGTVTNGSDEGTTAVESPTFEEGSNALSRVNSGTNNFGSFTFIDLGASSASSIKDVAVQNASYDNKYLYCPGIAKTSSPIYTDVKTVATTVGEVNGTALELGNDALAAAIPMAISAAIDFDGTNTAPNFMFKQLSGEVAAVDDDETADILDGMHVNYYGKTQMNGQELSFFQRGFNLDGEDTAVYFNELWLKSHIATAQMNLFVSVERVPANDDGESLIYTNINAAAQDGLRNGVIEVGKTFDTTQRAAIYQITGDAEAYLTIQESGFWLNVVIEHDGTEYYAKYVLVYGKGDSIRKVEGRDLLV